MRFRSLVHCQGPNALDGRRMGGFDLSPATLFAGMVVSGIGFAVFMYGKNESQFLQLMVGLAMMACPMFIPGAVANYLVGAALLGGLWAGARFAP
ncbi:MAG: hypothetical protein ACJAQ3_000930 [Planctomycetota bacterium]|jgi:hypothetical protein